MSLIPFPTFVPTRKVLQCYLWKKKAVVPINPREEEIEGQKCAKSLSELADPQDVAVSVVTPPGKGAVPRTMRHPQEQGSCCCTII